jgi:hypothetical protein
MVAKIIRWSYVVLFYLLILIAILSEKGILK